MSPISVANVLKLLHEFYSVDLQSEKSIITKEEIELKNHLKVIIDKFLLTPNFDVFEEDDLCFQNEIYEIDTDEEDSPIDNSDSQSQSAYNTPSPLPKQLISDEYKIQVVKFWRSRKKHRRNFNTVQHAYKKVESVRQLYDWEKQLKNGGTRNQKLKNIRKHTLQKFLNAKMNKLTVHDADLRRWALNKNREEQFSNFKASNKWCHKFKTQNRIVSRKITKFISIDYERSREDTAKKAEMFVEKVQPYFNSHGPDLIFNSDQSGFNKEVHSGRTLEEKGVKTVEAVVQSVNATTHSYTIQPTISAAGILLSPLYIVLQEPKGEFGPRVQDSIFQAKNVYVECSTSGKLTKPLMQSWFKNVYFPNVGPNSILLVDSWRTYNDSSAIKESTPEDKTLDLLQIPEKTTGIIQPLDVYGFRLWKNFVRVFSDRILLEGYNISLFQRNNIIKLQSLVHNQFSSPRFVELFKYGWYKSGYISQKPEAFKTPNEFCFNLNPLKCSTCEEINFIVCAWCTKPFCFTDFFTNYHFCETFQLD